MFDLEFDCESFKPYPSVVDLKKSPRLPCNCIHFLAIYEGGVLLFFAVSIVDSMVVTSTSNSVDFLASLGCSFVVSSYHFMYVFEKRKRRDSSHYPTENQIKWRLHQQL
ncbi:unnamed protein product [Cuscuta epithymum]|uniref:Uncharacterized protein n=1 Tax=Cuscuta epithymum TaxID=186058 RepID=A0AAV0DJU4_9ASTE|nr:unnamed protein product [Cuscuta epithymum]